MWFWGEEMFMKKIYVFCCSFFILYVSSYAAYLSNPIGNVYYKETDKWVKVDKTERFDIKPQSEISTERASSVEIYFDNGSKLKIGPLSYYKFNNEDEKEISSTLFIGKIRNWVKKQSKEYKVITPAAVCGVRGTDFVVISDKDRTRVEVYDGSVSVSDLKQRNFLVGRGSYIDVTPSGISTPKINKNPPQNLNSSLGDSKMIAQNEIYNEISKSEVIKRAQQELQTAEYQNRKTAVDAFGYRVRMEEYITRPQDNQFKYVVLNTREKRFDFGKILFTFNNTLPADLSNVTKNMNTYYGNTAPDVYLTDVNSVISNTVDKVTEDASGGKMIPDNPLNPSLWTHFFTNYSFYAAGSNEAGENGGKGKLFWSFSDSNNNGVYDSNEFTYLGGIKPTSSVIYPSGEDVLHSISNNTYSDGTSITAEDFVIFDDGNVAKYDDFKLKPGESKNDFIDKLNFERVYKSSIFSDKIDIVFSAKLLKDAGLINIK
jgi:hypothetical protein